MHISRKRSMHFQREVTRRPYLIIAFLAMASQADRLNTNEPIRSTSRRRMSAKRFTVLVAEIGTVLTKVMKERPLPRVNSMIEVLASKAFAFTLTSDTCVSKSGWGIWSWISSVLWLIRVRLTSSRWRWDTYSIHFFRGATRNESFYFAKLWLLDMSLTWRFPKFLILRIALTMICCLSSLKSST